MNIHIENLRKTFGQKVAVNIENYEIQSGQMLGLVGNNGAGKSTMFRMILDLIKADQGRVVMIPTPKGLVRISASPGLAAELVSTFCGCTKPDTARP